MATALAIFLMLAVSFYGWGKTALRFMDVRIDDPDYPSSPLVVWLGWAVTMLLFQILHFFVPLNAAAVLPVFGLGVILFVPTVIATYLRWRGGAYKLAPRKAAAIMGLLLAAVAVAGFVASRAMMPEQNYDSGLYHYNKIRWINEYPVVPGLGNVHKRLAFNNAFFHYAAAVNVHPYFNHGRSIANSFLFLLATAYLLDTLRPIFRRPKALLEAHPFRFVPAVFCLPFMVYQARFSPNLSSPTPDFSTILLQLVLFVELARGIGTWISGERRQHGRAVVIALLAGSAIAVKASNFAFCVVLFSFLLAYAFKTASRKPLTRAACLLCLMGGVWIITNYVLSGAPLFPSTTGRIEFEWSIPANSVIDLKNWVLSWARWPQRHWKEVLGRWDWVWPWLGIFFRESYYCYPVYAAGCLTVAAGVATVFRRVDRPRLLEWSLGLPVVAGLAFWFFTAPALRFAEALLFLLPIFAAALLLCTEHRMVRGWRLALSAITIFVAIYWQMGTHFIDEGFGYFRADTVGWQPSKKVKLRQQTTDTGLKVYLPETGNQCWDSPLPSQLYFDSRLRLRDPKSMAAGFSVYPPLNAVWKPAPPQPQSGARPPQTGKTPNDGNPPTAVRSRTPAAPQ